MGNYYKFWLSYLTGKHIQCTGKRTKTGEIISKKQNRLSPKTVEN